MFLVIFGPPGSGKGTQAKEISELYNIKQITTGDIFRSHMKKETALGKKAKEYVNRGLLVPDEIINAIVEEEMKKDVYKKGFVIDGYPRTLNQVNFLGNLLKKRNIRLNAVINLVVGEEEIVRRLSSRRMCSSCQSIFNLVFNPPKKNGVCDNCGGKLIQRDDDKGNVIKERLKVYERQTHDVLKHYKKKGMLTDVDGEQGAEKVFEDIRQILDRL
jgi:adenylate kinase